MLPVNVTEAVMPTVETASAPVPSGTAFPVQHYPFNGAFPFGLFGLYSMFKFICKEQTCRPSGA